MLHSVILTQQTYLGAFGRKCRLFVEAADEWQCSYILGSLDPGTGVCPSVMLPGPSLSFAPRATCGTGHWCLAGTDMSVLLRVLATISPSAGWRVRPYPARTKRFAFFSSGRRKCSLLDAPHQVQRKGNVASQDRPVSVLLRAGVRHVAVRKETYMHQDSTRCLFDNKVPN